MGLVSNEASHTPWQGLLPSRGCLNCDVIYHLGIVLIFLPCLTLSYLRVLSLLTSCSPIFLSDGNCRFLDMRDDSFPLSLFLFLLSFSLSLYVLPYALSPFAWPGFSYPSISSFCIVGHRGESASHMEGIEICIDWRELLELHCLCLPEYHDHNIFTFFTVVVVA
jgi:hypothetical protein